MFFKCWYFSRDQCPVCALGDERFFCSKPSDVFHQQICIYLFDFSPFNHWRGKLRKERDVQTSLRDFCSSLSVGERRIRVSHLPLWLISAVLNISNNFWGWEICGFLWVLGESCLNQWQRQLQLLSGLASGAKLGNFYSKFVWKFAGVDALQLLLLHTALTPSFTSGNFPSQRRQGRGQRSDWGSGTVSLQELTSAQHNCRKLFQQFLPSKEELRR